MRKSASKVMLLTATSGPIFRGKYHTLETQCEYLQKYIPRGTRKMQKHTPRGTRKVAGLFPTQFADGGEWA